MQALKAKIKAGIWKTASFSGISSRLLGGCAVILGLHRIGGDGERVGLDCSPQLFDEICGFLKANFRVLSLSDLAAELAEDRCREPLAAITFDDGYRDNLSLGAPILLKHGLPATFYLTTRFVGSQNVPWWDEKAGEAHEFLSWDQARELAGLGFELGGHTRIHPDLAKLSPEEAASEIAGCREDLLRETGKAPLAFAYPYGRPEHVTPEVREIVRQAGFTSCVSLYDGINPPGSDPFHLLRVPFSNFYVSAEHFGGAILGMAARIKR